MITFLFFVAASGLLFFAVVEMAFTLLMRLPERLEAERESDGDALGTYLDDPAPVLRARARDARRPAHRRRRPSGANRWNAAGRAALVLLLAASG